MPFVKLDCGILDSTLWVDRDARDAFVTALLMAEPKEFDEPAAQIEVRTLNLTGWAAPAGWYGFVGAAGVGIIRRAGIEIERGLDALERLGAPDLESRSSRHEGRRLARIDGGFLALNYIQYRDHDYSAAERSRRYRERLKERGGIVSPDGASRCDDVTSHRDITQAEAEVDKQKGKRRRASAPAFDCTSIEGLDLGAWNRWIEYRRGIGKALKPPSLSTAARGLAKFGINQAAVVERSIERGWTGFFALPPQLPPRSNGQPLKPERTAAQLAEDRRLGELSAETKRQFIARGVTMPDKRI